MSLFVSHANAISLTTRIGTNRFKRRPGYAQRSGLEAQRAEFRPTTVFTESRLFEDYLQITARLLYVRLKITRRATATPSPPPHAKHDADRPARTTRHTRANRTSANSLLGYRALSAHTCVELRAICASDRWSAQHVFGATEFRIYDWAVPAPNNITHIASHRRVRSFTKSQTHRAHTLTGHKLSGLIVLMRL